MMRRMRRAPAEAAEAPPQSEEENDSTTPVSNCRVPPNSQESAAPQPPRSPRFDDIIQSLTKMLNDCKEKRLCDLPLVSSRLLPETSGGTVVVNHSSVARTAAAVSTAGVGPPAAACPPLVTTGVVPSGSVAGVAPVAAAVETPAAPPRPVCEIKPYVVNPVVATAAAASNSSSSSSAPLPPPPPPGGRRGRARNNTRGGGGGGGGRNSRRQAASSSSSSSRRSRRRNNRHEDEGDNDPLLRLSQVAGSGRRRGPSFLEDGLEIIDPSEEAAIAAASIAAFFDD